MRTALIILALLLPACGGAAPDEEVSASWTSGDDAPLEDGDDAE